MLLLKANGTMDESQVDFIQTLKRSTISVATAISDYTPSGGIGCIPLSVSVLCIVCVCVCQYLLSGTFPNWHNGVQY